MEAINFGAISAWIRKTVEGFEPPYTFDLVAGGRSNLTYIVSDATQQKIVLRRPPTSHVLPTAHDMTREFKIISALARTDVPVPSPIALCADPHVTSNPFYLMQYVPGNVLSDADETSRLFDHHQRAALSKDFISILATIHTLDPETTGLADLGKRQGYIERQLNRWYTQYENSSALVDHEVIAIEDVYRHLSSSIPTQQTTSIVHGDFRLDNAIISNEAEVVAVIDWEIATLGDPLADLGLLMVYWTQPGDVNPPLPSVTALPGFSSRVEICSRYESITRYDLSDLPYYEAFGYWKLACILEGVYSRYMSGAEAGDKSDVTSFRSQVEMLSKKASETLES